MLYLHRGERADVLLSALADEMRTPLADPMTPEIICVPTRGVERWLSQGLARELGSISVDGDGVAANIEFPQPNRLVGAIVASVSGLQARDDPWLNGQAMWALVDVIDANMDSPWLALVAGQINSVKQAGRANRIRTAHYIWNLFDKYHQDRPEMIIGWAAGATDGPGYEPLATAAEWQRVLWQKLREQLAVPSPPERYAAIVDAFTATEAASVLDLPERIFLFGLTRLPKSHLDVVTALARTRAVHLFLLHPSPELWQAIDGSRQVVGLREGDRTRALVKNPLLASWGRDARELQLALTGSAIDNLNDRHRPTPTFQRKPTLLQQLQDDIRANRAPVGAGYFAADPRPLLAAGDHSVQVHSCHGEQRQVQVLRDAIMHLLDADPTLEPRDILIMCPDVEQYAPEIHAVFGAVPELRVRLADRSVAQTNPLTAAVALLLPLLDSRMTATEVMGLVHTAPVRERFGFTDDELDRIHEWILASGIRWGLDAPQRAEWHLDSVAENTWSVGVDRILLGAVMADEGLRSVGGCVPIDDVGSNDIDTVGRLAEFLDRLGAAAKFFGSNFNLDDGVNRLGDAVDQLMATSPIDAWQRQELARTLSRLRPASSSGAVGSQLINFAEFRDLIADVLEARPTRSNFRTGNITVCTLTPMRSIPHRVVCLLGLDDQRFPRAAKVSGDDLTQQAPFVGDHDARGEDRQLLLDAIMSAIDHVVITYSGRDERTNALKPPAVPLAELLSAVNRTVRSAKVSGFVTEHPLQPFDPRNFTTGVLTGRSWSYDRDAFSGALALQSDPIDEPKFLEHQLTALTNGQAQLDDLVRFVEHPVRAFVRTRLGIVLDDYDETLADELPLSMSSLDDWVAGEELINVLSNVADGGPTIAETGLAWYESAIARGNLPPGEIAREHLREKVYQPALGIAKHVRLARGENQPETHSIKIALDSGRTLVGSVSGVSGHRLVVASFSKINSSRGNYAPELKGKRRIATWVRLLALAVNDPATNYIAYLICKDKKPESPLIVQLTVPDNPAAVLADIVSLYDQGMRWPLPLYCETSNAYACATSEKSRDFRMKGAWATTFDFDHEDSDKYHRLVLNPVPEYQELLADAEFVNCAEKLWRPLLANESIRPGIVSAR